MGRRLVLSNLQKGKRDAWKEKIEGIKYSI